MTTYNDVVDYLQESVDNGTLSFEDAQILEEAAADRYGVNDTEVDMYNDVVDYLQEAVNEGSISLEDAQILEEAAADRYGVEYYDDDTVTLEDAMEAIDELLQEKEDALATAQQFGSKLLKSGKETTKKLGNKVRANAQELGDSVYDAFDDGTRRVKRAGGRLIAGKKTNAFTDFTDKVSDSAHATKRSISRGASRNYKKVKNSINDGIDSMKSRFTKESVDDMRLRVYEAYESGMLDEDEKDTYLEYLDLNNYE